MPAALVRRSCPPPDVAHRQCSVFTRDQAVAAGLSRGQVERRLAGGQWRRVAGRGLTAHHPPTGWTAAMMAWSAHLTWPDAVVTFGVAASLHGLPVPHGPSVHVLLPRPRRPVPGIVPHVSNDLHRDVVVLCGGVPAVGRVRAVADCLALMPRDEAWRTLAWVLSRRFVTHDQLTTEITRRHGHRGAVQLRELSSLLAEGAASPAEVRMHDLLHGAGLTGWRANATVHDDHGVIGTVDILFPDHRIVVEIDGFAAHAGLAAFTSDRRRQNRLVNAGYRVLRFTWDDLISQPHRVLAAIQAELSR